MAIDTSLFKKYYYDTDRFPSATQVAEALGIKFNKYRNMVTDFRKQGVIDKQRKQIKEYDPAVYNKGEKVDTKSEVVTKSDVIINRLEKENKDLKKSLEQAKDKAFTGEDIKELMNSVEERGFNTKPTWYSNKNSNSDTLVPVLFLTDTHIGEVIDPLDMGFIEAYNTDIAIKSINKITEDFINICINKMSNYRYNGVVLMLGGDLITGNLHDLAETNDGTPIQQIIDATNVMIQQIKKLKQAFGKVQIFGVTGNHGRLDSHNYTKSKKRTDNSLETLVYYYIKEHFKEDSSINFTYDKSDEVRFGICGRKFLLTHGDRGIRGGGGIGGIIVPIKRARAKMLQSAVAMNKEFDTLVIGHFHQHHISDDIIIGASTKPYDEYCRSMGFEYNGAGATSFFVNGHGEIIFATKLNVREENKKRTQREKQIELF